jgi:hypothetical protein
MQPETKPATKKFKIKKLVKLIVLVLFIAVFIFALLFLFNFINSTSRIISKESSKSCLANKYCIEIDGEIAKGWAIWKPEGILPAFFSITTAGFKEADKVKIICPTNLVENQDNILKKIEYSFGNQDLQKCRVEKRG